MSKINAGLQLTKKVVIKESYYYYYYGFWKKMPKMQNVHLKC